MPSVDDRIVKMEFNNAEFERKIATTLTSLGQLDKALKFTGATKGLQDVSDTASKMNFGSISNGIENVSKGFIAMSTIAITALSQITSKALQAGAAVVKAFTFAPAVDGFREYETQLNSVQTILANTASAGTTLEQVNEALQKLNVYSDQTIYNFGQMAKNIGTFTAAGVDLDTSVNAIKGIANLAAMSGSNAEQASGAMYQLSQAIATGSLKLIDWNSVVNAGMGGEVFKNALFETQKAMGNVLNVPVDQTFQQWEDAGNSFRETLQDGWITADVLTTTLSTFTGDMTEEMLIQKGFAQEQATAILKTAAIAKAAATEVKTFTQLMGTVKEAVGTGWADSFKIIIGNFTEAKALWTSVNNSIGTFVNNTSNARNAILQGWKDFGGRTALVETLKSAFHTLGEVLRTVSEAFREIFPATTSADLIRLTASFRDFVTTMIPSVETIGKIKTIFTGLFAALSIGWEIIKEGTKFIFNLGKSLFELVSGPTSDFFVKLAGGFTKLQDVLVKGGGIKDFFANLTEVLQKPIALLAKFRDVLGRVFDLFDTDVTDEVGDSVGRLSDRFGALGKVFDRMGDIWQPFEDALVKIVAVLDSIWDVIKDWFSKLGQKIADTMGEGSFNNVLDAINTGLLASIALLITKFFKDGFKFDLGGGFFEKVSKSFEELTGVFKAMQANIKANALLKIAAAIAILTASVVVLSMIDSAALSKALAAMAVGFAELMATFKVFTQVISDPKSAASFTIAAAGLILLASSMLIMAAAAKVFASMSWEEIAKGLVGIAGGLVIFAAGMRLMPKGPSMVLQAVGLTAVAVAMGILAVAMKIFATMSWEEIGKGMAGVAGGLGIIAGAMHLMPSGPSMVLKSAGLVAVAFALNLMGGAMKIFATMSWEEIGKGLTGMAGGLVAIAGAMQLMPISLPITAAGLVLVGIALGEIGVAMKLFAKFSWDEIARGLTGMAGALLILAGALYLMGQTGLGSASLVVAAVGLGLLFAVLKQFVKIDTDDLVSGLKNMGIALGALAIASVALNPAVPAILALGAALVVLGVGIALLGGGIYALAKGLETISKLGKDAASSMADVLKSVGKAMPALLTGVAQGIVDMIKVFTDAAPEFAKAIVTLLGLILTKMEELIPKAGIVIRLLIEELFKIIRSYGADYIKTGLFILTKLLEGLRDNIGPITTMVADIIINFLKAFENKIPEVAEQLADTIIAMYTAAAEAVGRVAGTLLFGIGIAFMRGFMDGLESSLGPVATWFRDLAGKVLGFIGDVLGTLVNKGIDIITGFLNGIKWIFGEVQAFFGNLPSAILGFIGEVGGLLAEKGSQIIQGLKNGIEFVWGQVEGFLKEIPEKIRGIFTYSIGWLSEAGKNISQGLWNGIQSIWGDIVAWVKRKVDDLIDTITHPWRIFSPSHLMNDLGQNIMKGWLIGLENGYKPVDKFFNDIDATDAVMKAGDNMSKALSNVTDKMNNMDEMNPVITPVLDLTQVEKGAKKIRGHIDDKHRLKVDNSNNHARSIARSQNAQNNSDIATDTNVPPTVISFEQTINAPTQLSTSDIYKATRNQITIAKEELSIR